MAIDASTLFQALINADTVAQKESPYAPFGDFASSLGQSIIQASPKYKPGESAIAGLVAGLVSGGATALTNNFRDKQNELAEQVLSGRVLDRPNGMSPGVFSSLRNSRDLYALQNRVNAQQAAAENEAAFQRHVAEKSFDLTADNPEKAKRGLAAAGALLSGQPAQTSAAAEPGSFDAYLKQFGGDESLARTAAERDLKKPDRLQDLRKEFESLPEVKNFVMADTGFKSMQRAIQDPTGTSDIELTRAAIQAIEPGLAVRMDDQQAIAASPALAASWKAQMLGAITGQSRLTDDVRQGLMRIAARRYNEQGAKFAALRDFFQTQAEKAGLDKTGVTYLGEFAPVDDKMGLDQSAAQSPNPPQISGRFSAVDIAPGVKIVTDPATGQKGTYEMKGGQWVRTR